MWATSGVFGPSHTEHSESMLIHGFDTGQWVCPWQHRTSSCCYRIEHPRDPQVLTVSHFPVTYPCMNRGFPNALDAVEHVER